MRKKSIDLNSIEFRDDMSLDEFLKTREKYLMAYYHEEAKKKKTSDVLELGIQGTTWAATKDFSHS